MEQESRIDLPFRLSGLREQTYHKAKAGNFFFCSPELTSALKGLSQQEHVDLFVTLLAALKVLLARYSRQEEIAVATPIIVGASPYRPLLLRTDLSGNPTFRELLRRIRDGCPSAYADQGLGAKTIEPQPDRDLTDPPAFQVLFAMHNPEGQLVDSHEPFPNWLKRTRESRNLELSLFVWEEGDELKGVIKYRADLFDLSSIERLSGHYQTLLKAVSRNPSQDIWGLPLLTQAELHQQFVEWNNTKEEYPKDQCAHRLFESQVLKTPEAIAVVFEDQSLTYRELNFRANRLAHYLQKLGVGSDVLVGLCINRSLDMVVGVLAIIKAGGAYVPFDPAYPSERLAFLIDDSRVSVLVTQSDLGKRLPPTRAKLVCLDNDWRVIQAERQDNPASDVSSENLAYVIYTSGSTGKPKGVAMSHGPLVNLVAWHHRRIPTGKKVRVAQFAPISFDVSFQEIFSTLCEGGTLVLLSESIRRDPTALLQFIERESIERLFVPFVMLQQLAAAAAQADRVELNLREIITAGEALHTTPQIARLFGTAENRSLHNHYGPTESHVVSSFTLSGAPKAWAVLPPIGRPISNTVLYILDRYLQPVPIGVPGELYIGGECLARGYLNRPELTAERFIANPFSTATGARLYKTGDLARYLPDGNIEYLGRIDNQVKLRGFRIELGEIEAVIAAHAGVRDAAVIVREDSPGDKRLVGYVIQKSGAACTSGELRAYVQRKLPEYMVPSAFVVLDAFPSTPSGKIDRRAFPAPNVRSSESETFVSPRDHIERQLASLWGKLLTVGLVGIHDNFFDLGGNSLLALSLMAQIKEMCGRNLPLGIVYQAPTVEQLAKFIVQDVPLPAWSSLVPLQSSGSGPPFFWIHGENSDAFLPRFLGADQPVYGLRHQSEDGRPARYSTVEEIAAHHLSEIRTVQPHGPYFLGGYCFGGMVAFEVAQQLQKAGEKIPLVVLLAPETPHCQSFSSAGKVKGGFAQGTSFGGNVHRYLQMLKPFERVKLSCLLAATAGKMKEHLCAGRKLARQVACKLYFGVGYPLPIALRSPYILNVYEQAASAYVPEIYAGRLVVFKPAEESESAQAWQRFAGGDFEVHEIFGNHTDVVNKEGCVRLWAEQLRTYLEAYQTTYRKFTTSTVSRKECELRREPPISPATVLTASV